MEKLLKKYKAQLSTLKENKKQASKEKKYPYEVAIEIVEDFIKDLKRVMAKSLTDDSNCITSDVDRSFSLDEIKKAFEDGSLVTSWSDMGVSMKYDRFEDWFKENMKAQIVKITDKT